MNKATTTEEAFRSLIEASPLAVFDLDPQGRVKSIWNEAAENIFGWKKEEVLGNRLPIITEEKQAEFDRLREKVLSGDSFSGVEVKHESKDGSTIDVSVSTAPIHDRSGQVVGIMALVEEVTARKELERSIEKREKKFREIFNNANDALYFQELTENLEAGKFLEVNDRACEMLGYSREELLEMTPREIDAGEEVDVEGITEELASKGHLTFETAHEAKDGTRIPVEISSHFFKLDEKNRVLSIARDISERKEAERQLEESRERLEAAMEAGNLAWWRMELPSGEVEFSELKTRMLGYSPDRFKHYNDFTDLLHPEDREEAMEAMRDHLEGKAEKYEAEYRIKKKDGSYKWFRDVGSVTELEGEDKVVTGVVIDIDKRKEAEFALGEQRAKLKELHGAVDKFQQCKEEGDLYETAIEVTSQVLDFDYCTIYRLEDEKLVPVATTEEVDKKRLTAHELGEGLAGKAFQSKKAISGKDLRGEKEAATARTDLRGYMSVPIRDIGVFQAASKKVGAFDEDDLELAEIMAGHLNEEVKRIRLQEKLREQAIRDPLTGLYNRRYFNETIPEEVERCNRYGHELGFLMIDVNRFKEINDRYSHQIGDRVLKEVAELIEENVRDADTVVRYGGDEFLVMFPETDGEVKNTVDRLRGKTEDWNKRTELLDFTLRLAMGISHWNPDQGRGVEEALNEADRKMYKDKEK
ncbi:PAS domain S-box protein [Candidatus Bipolaricaulota bacterium]|nr:PAS domain S-box protein [Candidatus Bipolaricaulota bacterium]